ncbi:MAG: hypothetical protein RR505_04345, partial [Raoultibacter sp.]
LRIIAYVDDFARVFTTSSPVTRPPATEPDLSLARYPEQGSDGFERGIIQVLCSDGVTRRAAEYRCRKGSYSVEGSWFDFGAFGQNVSFEELLVRTYLAFVYRPTICDTHPPLFGIGNVESALMQERPLDAMESIDEAIAAAEADPSLSVPALERCLVRWLREAGIGSEALRSLRLAARGNPLRLVRTIKYANLFYLGSNDEEETADHQKAIWELEAALNRFLLVAESLGDQVLSATEAQCAQWDYYLIETIGNQMPAAEAPVDTLTSSAVLVNPEVPTVPAGEWAVRYGIARAIESLRLPYRFTSDFRVNVAGGLAAFDLVVPSATSMAKTQWPDQSFGWVDVPEGERIAQANRYAMRLAIMVAAIAFYQSSLVNQVNVAVRPVVDKSEVAGAGSEFPHEADSQRTISVTFERAAFCTNGAYRQAALGDPEPFFLWFGAQIGCTGITSPLEDDRLAPAWRMLAPEVSDRLLSDQAKAALGINEISELGVNYDAARRRIAEHLADGIVQAENTTERIKLVSAVKDEATDPLVEAGCTRLMIALTDGSIDATDQNIIVNIFLGEDELIVALTKAQALAQDDPDAAITILTDAIAVADLTSAFSDNGGALSRCFDSYASRLLYNLARRDGLLPQDAGKPVQLVADSLYFCCLEAVKLLERSFDRTEDALRFGKRCIGLAPMSGPGYLQTARAYMLVGDMDHTVATINEYLRIAVLSHEIAVAYYQLAYAEWKAGRVRVAIAAYLKSMSTSPAVYDQSKIELEELLRESKSELIPPDEIDDVLAGGDIRVAPSDELLDQLLEASKVVVDTELFVVARSALSAYCQFRPDDAVVNVLRSLGD